MDICIYIACPYCDSQILVSPSSIHIGIMMSILSQSTSRLSTTASVDTKITSNKETSQLLPDGSKYLPTGAFGIKSEYTMHKEVLSLKVKPKMMSATLLDMSVIDENTKEEVFKVHGKLASLHREVHVRTKNGKQLYTLKQSWTESKKSIYSFHAVDEESSLANANVFSAQAKGSLRNDCFDLSLTFQNQLDQGEKATMYLRTGIVSAKIVYA